MVRKSAALRKETDMKVDGAFQDAVLKPIPGTGDFGGYQAQENQIDHWNQLDKIQQEIVL
jgi:hypothetical protein